MILVSSMTQVQIRILKKEGGIRKICVTVRCFIIQNLKMHHLLNLFFLYAFSAKLNKIKNPIRVNEYLETQGCTEKSTVRLLAVLFHYLVLHVQKQYCN